MSDDVLLNFPTGAVLIKTFFYDNVLPDLTTQIIETRLLIKKEDRPGPEVALEVIEKASEIVAKFRD